MCVGGWWAVVKAIPEPKGDGIEGIGLYPESLSIPRDDNFQRWLLHG